jgi:FtsZ-binding cell division protein ZapB
MSNPGVIFLAKFQRGSFYFAVEDNIGEAIHIHYADAVVNMRVDLTIHDFFNLAADMEHVIDMLLDGKAKYSDFDPIFFAELRYDALINLKCITSDSVMLEDLLVQDILSDGNIQVRPMTEARLGKAFSGDHSENDIHSQINYFSPTGKISTNRDRINENFQRIKENDGFSKSDCVWLVEGTNFICDGHHRSMSLYALKGNCRVPVRRIWFSKDKIIPAGQIDLEEKNRQLEVKINAVRNEINTLHEETNSLREETNHLRDETKHLHNEIDSLHKEIVEKTSLRYFARNVKAFIRNRILRLR